MTPRQVRGKIAVRAGIEACGKIGGAADEAGRAESTVGDWNNREKPVFPPADCAVALDDYTLGRGDGAPITEWMVRELGGVLVFPPQAPVSSADWHSTMETMVGEHADLLGGLLRDLADRKIDAKEAESRRADTATLLTIVVEVDQRLRAIAEGRE